MERQPIINTSPAGINRTEPKTRRGNILLRPTTWVVIQKILRVTGGSFNNLVSTLLEDYAEQHAECLQKYEKIMTIVKED